jgi:hypothetical protein
LGQAEVQRVRQQSAVQTSLALVSGELAEIALEASDPQRQLIANLGALVVVKPMQPSVTDGIVNDRLSD